MQINVKKLHPKAQLPLFGRNGDAGADLFSVEDVLINEHVVTVPIHTGIALEIPPGYAGYVQPRSGLAKSHSLTVTNSPGLIDSNYRGEIIVLMYNLGTKPYVVHSGDKIAQLVILQMPPVNYVEADIEMETVRGANGFGSSGYK